MTSSRTSGRLGTDSRRQKELSSLARVGDLKRCLPHEKQAEGVPWVNKFQNKRMFNELAHRNEGLPKTGMFHNAAQAWGASLPAKLDDSCCK